MTVNPHDELFDRARKTIRELRDKLSAAEERNRLEPIAVIGLSINFPGSGQDLDKFWQMIVEGQDAVTNVPLNRWDSDAFFAPEAGVPGKINTRRAAFLDDVERFDADFFDITPREAVRMDPQQRIFLETAWHVLENAGLPKTRIAGNDLGIFIGIHSQSMDYQAMQFENPATLDAYSASGTAHDMIGARLAYWLDVHGPAFTVNTGCSSSLLAVHLACQSLRAGDCTQALVGGLNLLLTPGSSVAAAQLHLLSPDGRCKSFDARADGIGRGEGCGIVILKKLAAAQRDGDRVLAVIRGSAVNQDGKTNGLTAPNGLAQRRVLKRALENAAVKPWEIGYVEAHGTGTALGDPIEVEALAEVFGGASRRTEPCTLGAVKANIGHLEGAAGVAGLIKAILVLQHRWLPPVANLQQLNPHLQIAGTGLNIPQQGCEWKSGARRLAGVSSFGWSGTNVHVVLEEAPAMNAPANLGETLPLLISAQSPEALRSLAHAFSDRLERADRDDLRNICYTAAVRRTHHACRIAVSGSEPKEIAWKLRRRVAEWIPPSRSTAQTDSHRAEDGAQNLGQAMRSWETGAEIDWEFAFPVPGSVVDLPLYPFQGCRHWLDTTARSTARTVQTSLPENWLYSTQWTEMPLVPGPASSATGSATWLIFRSGGRLGASLSEAVRRQGDRVIEIQPGELLLRQTMNEVVDGKNSTYALYCIGSLRATKTIEEVIEIAQSFIRSGNPTRLWFVVQEAKDQEAEARSGANEDLRSSSAAIRGFSRVLGLEHPEVCGGVIDTDSDDQSSANAILQEIRYAAGEDRISFRQGARRLARLRRESLPMEIPGWQLKSDRWYLVTGAFGRLGMEIAKWLVGSGARFLVLVGRRNPSQMDDPALLLQLEALKRQGVTVIAESCDVSNESEVSRMLAQIDERGGKLAGIVHAATAVQFCPIVDVPQQDVEATFSAKVLGALMLDRCTRHCDLDFFILFGSAAATIGMRNGAVYAAANGCLDALVLERETFGLPVLCVEWGAWDDGRNEKQVELIERSGFVAMPPQKALRVLGALVVARVRSALVADIDWRVLGPGLESRGKHSLAISFVERSDSLPRTVDSQPQPGWLDSLRGLPPHERRQQLLDLVATEVRIVFGMVPGNPVDEGRGLFQLGMDSLMSVKLRRRLEAGTGLRLSGTLTFTYPTITAIAEFLEQQLFSTEVPASAGEMPSRPEVAGIASVDEMNDAETSAAIAAELAAIQQKLGAVQNG